MASGRIDESQLSSDEEQEVFAGFTIKGIEKMQQAHQAWQEQNLLHNVDNDRKDFFNLRSQERGSDSDVELYASDEEEESDESSNEESATEESQPNALQWSSTLQQINVKQFSIHHGPTRDLRKKMQLPKTSSMYLSTMLTLMKLSNKQLHKLIRKGIKCSQQPEQKFQPISG